MKRSYQRSERVADLIQKTLAQMLLQEMSDDRFRLVTITSVEVSRDLSYAKVYVSVFSEDVQSIKDIVKDLNLAAKPLRYNLAQAVKLRVAPELKFVYDESIARGFKISSLIENAVKKAEDPKTKK